MKGCTLMAVLLLGTLSLSLGHSKSETTNSPSEYQRSSSSSQSTYPTNRPSTTPSWNTTSPGGSIPTRPTLSPSTSTSSTPYPNATNPSTTPTPTSTTPSSCGFEPDCPLRGTKYIANPCPRSCQKYFVCTEGTWTAKACFPWENFHPQKLSCDWWWNVDCSWLQPTTTPPVTTTFPDVVTPVPITPRPPCSLRPKCPSSGSTKIADPCVCQKFYECADGESESKTCLPWENFDPNKLECVFMLDVDCNWPYYDPTNKPPQPSTSRPTLAPSRPTRSTTDATTSTLPSTPINPTMVPSRPTASPTNPTQTPINPRPTSTNRTPTPTNPRPTSANPTSTPTRPRPTSRNTTPTPTNPRPTSANPTSTPTRPRPTSTNTTPTPTDPWPTSTNATPTSTTTTSDPNLCSFKPSCPAVGKKLIPIPCKGFCAKYYECKNGVPIAKTCSKVLLVPTYFHPKRKTCLLSGLVNCDWYKDPNYETD